MPDSWSTGSYTSSYAESIEQRVAADAGISVHRCLAIPAADDLGECVTILMEGVSPNEAAVGGAVRSVRAVTSPSLEVRVFGVEAGAIARTTSGKVRRRFMWQQLRDGELDLLSVDRAEGRSGATGAVPAR
jgi:hypothetical protein